MSGFVSHGDGTATFCFEKDSVAVDQESGAKSIVSVPARLLFPGPCNPSQMAPFAAKALGLKGTNGVLPIQVRDNGDGTYGVLPSAQESLGITKPAKAAK